MDAEEPDQERADPQALRDHDRNLCRLIAPFVVLKEGGVVWCCKSSFHKSPHSGMVGMVKSWQGERPLRFRWPGEGPRSGERYPDASDFRRRGESL